MKTNCGIYKITNLIPNEKTNICKVYIGSSHNLKSRKWNHFNQLKIGNHLNIHLQNAVKKYSIENFKFEVIQELEKYGNKEKLKEELLKEEQEELNKYKKEDGTIDHNKCYNMLPIAGSRLGSKHTEETLNKLKGRKHTKETKEKMSESHKGDKHHLYNKHHSEETKEKLKEARKKRITSEETKKKMSESRKGNKNHNYGKKFSEEHKKKLSEARKSRELSEEEKERARTLRLGCKHTEESKMKMRKPKRKKQ